MASECLIVRHKFVDLWVGKLRGPPDPGKDVVGGVSQGLARICFGSTCAIADHLMVHAGLDVLSMHRDVILQVRVSQKDISPSVLHFLQKTRKVGRAQVKCFTEDNAEVSRVLLNPFVNAFAIVDAVVRVLKCQSQLQAFMEFLMVDKTAEKLSCRVAQEVGGAKSPDNILIAPAENSSSSRTGGDPRGLVSVRHPRFGLAESSRVATEDRHDIIR